MRLAEALKDSHRAAKLEELHYELSSKVEAMELNKSVLKDKLATGLQETQQQREELDKKDRELVTRMQREDQENEALIGTLLQESVQRIFVDGAVVTHYI